MNVNQLAAYNAGKQVKRHALVHVGLPPMNAKNMKQYVEAPWPLSAIGLHIAKENNIKPMKPKEV